MSTVFKKIFLTCVLTLVVLTTGAWQSNRVVLTGNQNLNTPTIVSAAPANAPEQNQSAAVGSFTKTSPAKGATNLNPTSTVLSWGTYSPTPDKYSFCVKEGSICEENDPNWTGTYLSTSVTLTNLAYNKTYYWQVKAITCATCVPKKFVYADGGWWTFTTKAGSTSVNILGNAGVAGATLTYTDSIVKTVTSDSSGNYLITVPIGWSGTLTPTKTGYVFTPTSASFSNLTAAQTIQNFIAATVNLTSSVISGDAGVAGAILNYTDGVPKTALADSMGFYTFNVSPNWSGTVVPSKGSYFFTPANRVYSNVVSNQSAQNYAIAIFSDVSSTYWAFNSIERLYMAGITGGCVATPLSYCPENTVTRAEMAVFLLKGIHGSAYLPPAVGTETGFTDVPITHWAAAWIKQLAAEKVTGGCGTGTTYCPEATATQAEMAIFLLRSKHGPVYIPPAVGTTTGFSDVPITHWAAAWIKQLVAEGISTGCGGSNFCPETKVTRAQMAVLVVKTFSLPKR